MKLLLITAPPLSPYLARLLPTLSHEIALQLLPDEESGYAARTQELLHAAKGFDAVLLLAGAQVVPEDGLTAGNCPLIVPRVHNPVSLLLGTEQYRRLFEAHHGNLCFSLPECNQEIFACPASQCQCLCYLADTQLCLHDTSLSARIIAQHHDWDFLNIEGNPDLLRRLVAGDWRADEVLTAQPGQRVIPTYRRDLLAVEG